MGDVKYIYYGLKSGILNEDEYLFLTGSNIYIQPLQLMSKKLLPMIIIIITTDKITD